METLTTVQNLQDVVRNIKMTFIKLQDAVLCGDLLLKHAGGFVKHLTS